MFVQPNLWTNNCGAVRKAVGTGRMQMLGVELAEAFFSAELIELGGNYGGGMLVSGPGELGIELQRR